MSNNQVKETKEFVGGNFTAINQKRKYEAKQKYEGKIFQSKKCGDFVVLEFKDCFNVSIKFLDTGYEAVVASENMKRGLVKDYYAKHTHGVGYLGSANASVGYEHLYQKWVSMISRCYGTHKDDKYYEDCDISEDFLNFTKFRDWALSQKGSDMKGWVLDKDLLSDGVKMYSANTCCFIPHALNVVFNKKFTQQLDGSGIKSSGTGYCARISKFGKYHHLGTFSSKERATEVYCEAKREYIIELADLYKLNLEIKVYEKITQWFN